MATSEEILTASILAELEKGNLPPWQKPWTASTDMPRNAATGKAYRGGNVFLLLLTGQLKGYTDPRWLTYKQAQTLGGTVKKGEKSTPVVFWKPLTRNVEDANGTTVEERAGAMLRFYSVFNVEQTDGCKVAPLPEVGPAPDPIEAAEAIIAGMPNPPKLRFGGSDRACYSPMLDLIMMPAREAFHGAAEVYSTLFHEHGHSTGHESRLGRKGVTEGQHFGSDAYGREELVAEMTAAFLGAECGIAPAVIENTVAYLANWIAAIKEDPRVILTAAAQAQKAADYILDRQPASAETVDSVAA